MHKFLLLLALFATGLQAQEATENTTGIQIAMGDTGSLKSSLSDAENAPVLTWAQLSGDQRKVLTPLASEWDTLRPWQRAKMLDIAGDYPKMDAQKQQRVQKRLTSWSRMTPYERENARQRYQQFHALSADKKDEIRKKWAEHQKLPEAEREKLRKDSGEWDYDPDVYN
jgi:Protein of unknown function (DUF3106)